MRWWLRILVTLALAPLVWELGSIYLGSTRGGSPDALLASSLASLPKLYLIYTLPALALVVIVLVPAGRLLARVGADLLIVAVAPALAVLVTAVLSHLISDPRLAAAGLTWLAFVYGLVYGLTVREPREPPAAQTEATPA